MHIYHPSICRKYMLPAVFTCNIVKSIFFPWVCMGGGQSKVGQGEGDRI